jgi:hypothetical protein
MTPGPHPTRLKGTWYVSYESKERVGKRAHARETKTFPSEQEAKAFAKMKLAEGLNVNVGTLNPHQPKRTFTSLQIPNWLGEEAIR